MENVQTWSHALDLIHDRHDKSVHTIFNSFPIPLRYWFVTSASRIRRITLDIRKYALDAHFKSSSSLQLPFIMSVFFSFSLFFKYFFGFILKNRMFDYSLPFFIPKLKKKNFHWHALLTNWQEATQLYMHKCSS